MPEELVQQEYYCSFSSMNAGTIYGRQMEEVTNEGRVTQVPHDRQGRVSGHEHRRAYRYDRLLLPHDARQKLVPGNRHRGHHVTNNRFFGYSGSQLTSGIVVAGGVTNNAIANNLFKEVATPGP